MYSFGPCSTFHLLHNNQLMRGGGGGGGGLVHVWIYCEEVSVVVFLQPSHLENSRTHTCGLYSSQHRFINHGYVTGNNGFWSCFPVAFSMNGAPTTMKPCSLQWHHNERNGILNRRRLDFLLNRLFRRRSKKISKLRVTGLCEGNTPVTGEFPAQMASNAENVSIWWRHHAHQYQRDCTLAVITWTTILVPCH